jgi:hypothetical protein
MDDRRNGVLDAIHGAAVLHMDFGIMALFDYG